ncbi:DUF6603 domain-containing protein [Tateyamaria pelophila]|uniref:DUF6603 domain-containing protein n=1 Tax=Tateyamaria pelophila TaxID=328415 RepID=UPI001CBFF10B|nr:DUF6603 domain-containing protein [Tateyamaria pelophila]
MSLDAPASGFGGPVLEGLDPRLGVFGQLLGLLNDVGDDQYTLNGEWFKNPIEPIQSMVEKNPHELLTVIMSFLGDQKPSPLDEKGGEFWYAIEYPKDGKQVPTGMSLVARKDDNASRISLGIAYDPFASTDADKTPLFAIHLLAQLPIIDLAKRSFLLGQADQPVQLLTQLRGADGTPFSVANGSVSVLGLDIVGDLFTNKSPQVQFLLKDLVLGGADVHDLDAIELIKDPSTLLGDVFKALLIYALNAATDAAAKGMSDKDKVMVEAMEQGVLWLLGLPSRKNQASAIPPMDWAALVGSDFGAVWEKWFLSIVDDAALLRQWLHGIYCMAQGLDIYDRQGDIDKDMHGAGTLEDPFAVTFFDGGDSKPSFEFTLAVDGSSPIELTLGARMSAPTKKIEGLDFGLSGKATLAKITLGGSDPVTIQPSFEISATANRPDNTTLFTYDDKQDPAYSIAPTRFHIGLKMDAGAPAPVPFGDFEEGDKKTLSLVTMLTRGTAEFDILELLLDKLHDDGVWQAFFNELIPPDSGLTYGKGVFHYAFDTVIQDRPVTVALSGGKSGDAGISVDADVGLTVDPLNLGLKTGLRVKNVTKPTSPVFTFTADAGGGTAKDVPLPKLTADLDDKPAFTLVGELPIKGFEDAPIRFGMVPLTGFEDFTAERLMPMLQAVVLDFPAVKAWFESPITQSVQDCTWAAILIEWGFFVEVDDAPRADDVSLAADQTKALRLPSLPDYSIDFAKLKALSPVDFFKAALSKYLAEIDEQILYKIGKDDGLYLTHAKGSADEGDEGKKGTERYGLRLAMKDVVVAGDKKKDDDKDEAGKAATQKDGSKDTEDPPEKTKVILQLGKWMSDAEKDAKTAGDEGAKDAPEEDKADGEDAAKEKGGSETDKDNWLTKTWGDAKPDPPKRGIHLDLIKIADKKPEFDLKLKLVSVGLDVEGNDKNPLFDIKGYKAEGMQARVYFSDVDGPVKVGGGVRVERASLPLGPAKQPEDGTKNPVASGLLSSGDKDAKSGNSKAKDGKEVAKGDPVNPEFGVQIAYCNDFDAEILNDDPEAGDKVWIPVEKSFGPMFCRKVGLGFDSERHLLVGFDGSVELGPLGIDLMNLSVGIPLTHPQDIKDYTLDLGGLDLTFQGGPVEISGSFLEMTTKVKSPNPPPAEIDVVQYTGAALIKTEVFSLTGLGSYASIDGSPSMFVFAVLDKNLGGPVFFNVTALAAGFGFKRKLLLPSIDQVQEFPLVKVISDPSYIANADDPEEALKKLSEAIPPDPSSYWLAAGVRFRSFEQIETVALLAVTFGTDLSVSVLGLSKLSVPAHLKASENPICYAELALRAEFNPAVGVLSVEARLTSNSYVFDKDCKLTGGFAFFTWFKGDHEGDFVVTLGGYHPDFKRPDHYPVVPRLGLDWKNGDIRITGELYFALTPSCLMAGGKLAAVYDIGWAKAWFVAYADFIISWKPFFYRIRIGVSIGASATVRVDLGLFTVSMTFKFELGADLHICGPDFTGEARIKFYVVSFTVHFGADGSAEPAAIDWHDFSKSFLPKHAAVTSVVYAGGLLQEWDDTDNDRKIPLVNAQELVVNVQTMAPCTDVSYLGKTTPGGDDYKSKLGIKPLYSKTLDSPLKVRMASDVSGDVDPDLFEVKVIRKGFPDAMWGQGKPDLKTPGSKLLQQVPAGLSVTLSEKGKQSQVRHGLPAMEIQAFAYEPIDKSIFWGDVPTPKPVTPKGKEKTFADIITSSARDPIMDVLNACTPHPLNKTDLTLTADRAETIYQSEPTYATLGQPLPAER